MRKEREWKSRALDSRNRDKNCSFLVFSMFCHSSYGRKVPDDHYHPMDSCWLFSMLMRWAVGIDELKLIEYDKWILPVHVCVCFFPYLNWLKIIFLMISLIWLIHLCVHYVRFIMPNGHRFICKFITESTIRLSDLIWSFVCLHTAWASSDRRTLGIAVHH